MGEVIGLTRKFLTLEDSLFTRSLEGRIAASIAAMRAAVAF